jgi:hypothetical protein
VSGGSWRKIYLTHAFDSGNASTTNFASWSGSVWVDQTLSQGAVIQAYGCGG